MNDVTCDPAVSDEGVGLTGLQILQAAIADRTVTAPIAKLLSFELVEANEGFAVVEGDTGEHLLNQNGVVHGGWALTLIDSACGCAALSVLPQNTSYASVETKANFSRPIFAKTGRVRAEGRIVAAGKRIISTECCVTGPDGKVLAHGTSTVMVLSER